MRKERSDKGLKRPKYTQNIRKLRKAARELRETLQDVERFERFEQLRIQAALDKLARKDAKLSSAKIAERRVARHAKRAELLQRLVPNRVCIDCNKTFIKGRAWVYVKSPTEKMICRGCAKRNSGN